MENKAYIITPLHKGYQVDTYIEGKPRKSGHSSRKNAINSILNSIPASHQLIITDLGEVK